MVVRFDLLIYGSVVLLAGVFVRLMLFIPFCLFCGLHGVMPSGFVLFVPASLCDCVCPCVYVLRVVCVFAHYGFGGVFCGLYVECCVLY